MTLGTAADMKFHKALVLDWAQTSCGRPPWVQNASAQLLLLFVCGKQTMASIWGQTPLVQPLSKGDPSGVDNNDFFY